MAHKKASPQIEADRRLLAYKTYDDYLDSLITGDDYCYLQSVKVSRNIAELGYRSSGKTLSREEFRKRYNAVMLYIYPPYKPYELASERMMSDEPARIELALRERPNRVGILSTIIFVRYLSPGGYEVSGYIDYSDKLTQMDWKPFFQGESIVHPKSTDLGYYHWRGGQIKSNNSTNYKVMLHPVKGLLFQNRFDRKVIATDPCLDPGSNTTRKRVFTDLYEHMILIDHVMRQRI